MTTTTATTREVIERYFDCVNRGAWDECLTLISDDVVGDDQLAGHFAGIDFLRRGSEAIRSGARVYLVHPQHIVVEGDAGCVIWRCEAEDMHGVKLAYPGDADRPVIGASYFQLQSGKITYMRMIHDSVPFARFAKPTQP